MFPNGFRNPRRSKLSFLFILAIILSACKPSLPATSTPFDPTLIPPPLTEEPQGRRVVITSTDDNGPGTLRLALEDAQPHDTITFDLAAFPPGVPETISLTSGLPQITQNNLTIDASNAGVILDGVMIPRDTWVPGLEILSDGNTIRGLQVINFTGTGIAVAQGNNNIIGGDRNIGIGPLGQGNLCSGNDFGIGIWDFASNNMVIGNYVGTDVFGTGNFGNQQAGVWVTEGGKDNVVGPDNIIAFNGGYGFAVQHAHSTGNTFTQNSVHDNGIAGIGLQEGGNISLDSPMFLDFDWNAGEISGFACAGCAVEVFSDHKAEGANYEGQATADDNGAFSFVKGAAFTFPQITLTASDQDGNTSSFSVPTTGEGQPLFIQESNSLPKYLLVPHHSGQLPTDSRIGWGLYSSNIWGDIPHLDSLLDQYMDFGIKRIDTSMQEIEEPINWTKPEFKVFPEYDYFIDGLNENGVVANYLLHFWDKDGRAAGEELSTPRFKEAEQVEDFLDYVRFVVDHFKGRIQYYTIWSEPDACGGSGVKCIQPEDYINLVREVIPVIHQVDPQAKVSLAPNVLYFDREYLFTVMNSDVISMFDAIQWHGIYDPAPESEFYRNYYYEYPGIVEDIKQTAKANGFNGEYWATEITWCSDEFPTCHGADQPWEMSETDKIAAKYDARSFIMHLGMDVGVGWGGLESVDQPWTYPTVQRLNTVMAGTSPIELAVEIENEPPQTLTYAFTTPDGDKLFALWTDGVAVDNVLGIKTNLTFPSLSPQKVVGINVLNGFEQELITETKNGDLVIPNLLVKDYPIIIRLID